MKYAKPISIIFSNVLYMQQPLSQKMYFFTDHVFKTPETKLSKYSLIETNHLLVYVLLFFFNMICSSIPGKDKFEMVTVVMA